MKLMLIFIFTITIMWSSTICRKFGKIKGKRPITDDASCELSSDYTLYCFNLQASSMNVLAQALEETSQTLSEFSVFIEYSSGADIPADVFLGYNLTSIQLLNNNFPAITYELLSSIDSNLSSIYLVSNNFTDLDTGTDIYLPFSEYLSDLIIQSTNIQILDVSTFMQYSNIISLDLDNNWIRSIGLEFLNLKTLLYLDLNWNKINSIETGAFRDLQNLQELYLHSNNLSTLQEGAFMGLETSPITDIDLSSNPWDCSCDLQWLKDWLSVRNLTDISKAVCASPVNASFSGPDFC